MNPIAVLATLLFSIGLSTQDPGQRPRATPSDRFGLLEVNELYFDLAANTGGDFYFWAPGEFAKSNLQLPIHDEEVVLAYGRLEGPTRNFSIPVESGARTLTIFSGVQRKDIVSIIRPDGSVLAAGSPGTKLQSFRYMTIATVDAPAPGAWRLVLSGAGTYAVTAHVRAGNDTSAPGFNDFEFVQLGGRPAHEGWFPIQRDLRKGETIECATEVAGRVSGVEFAFVTRDDRVIASVPMQADEEGDNYFGRCQIPNIPFRVAVSGRDEQGRQFRRIESGINTPK